MERTASFVYLHNKEREKLSTLPEMSPLRQRAKTDIIFMV